MQMLYFVELSHYGRKGIHSAQFGEFGLNA